MIPQSTCTIHNTKPIKRGVDLYDKTSRCGGSYWVYATVLKAESSREELYSTVNCDRQKKRRALYGSVTPTKKRTQYVG